jgi:hypothetical protein
MKSSASSSFIPLKGVFNLHPSSFVFFATFAVYAALVPWMVRVWQRTGDEPHYLLAAHSLAFDGDLDLHNNYASGDFLSFYGDPRLTPHTRPGPGGQAVLTHNLGLSLLVAPAYRLGGLVGVEYFLAALGAFLAANVYLLGYEITYDWRAAAVGWIAVSFTPPLLWYVFLIYPEMVAGLCIIVALRRLLRNGILKLEVGSLPLSLGPLPLNLVSCALSLAFLPWLSSRYLPVFGLLVLGAAWHAWRDRSRGWLLAALGGLGGLGAYMLFSQWLYGSASPAAAYAGPTPLAFEESFALVRFARGLFGWLVDNQRGLLVAAPIYVAALWGGALLLRRRPASGAAVMLPFAVMLITVAAWGGFWIGWEHSARFLVAGLPPLGAGVAGLWSAGRRGVAIPLTAILFGLSLASGRAVIAKPIAGIISSPVEILKPLLNVESLVPAMAGYRFIPAGHDAVIGAEGGLGWETRAGRSGIILRQVDAPEFPFGWYTARLPMQADGAGPDTPIANVKIFSPRGGDYFSQTVRARDLSRGVFTFSFKSPLYNGWAFPPTVLISATGKADLSLGSLAIEPETFHSLVLPALWLIVLTVIGFVVTSRFIAKHPFGTLHASPSTLHPPRSTLHASRLTFISALIALASVIGSLRPHARTYAAVDLERNVGVVVEDSLAYRGKAMQASPEAGQTPGMLAITLPEIYAPGRYRLTVSLRALSGVDDIRIPARVRVLTPGVAPFPDRWDVPGLELPADGQYHLFAFDFENPRQQALVFILDYTAAAGLRADRLIASPGP